MTGITRDLQTVYIFYISEALPILNDYLLSLLAESSNPYKSDVAFATTNIFPEPQKLRSSANSLVQSHQVQPRGSPFKGYSIPEVTRRRREAGHSRRAVQPLPN